MLASTNKFAKGLIKCGCTSGTVVWALEQTAGKGRRGRTWDGDNSSLTFSLIWKCSENKMPENLTLAVGLGLVQALEHVAPALKVKWPNDLWLGEKKLAGILTESILRQGDLWLILGIGINVNGIPPRAELSPRTSLQEETGCFWPRFAILDLALKGIECGFGLTENPTIMPELFRKYGNFLDRPITVWQGQKAFKAIAREVLADGRLLIEDAQGCWALLPEEISLRF